MKKQISITGCTGFVGTNLRQYLSQDYKLLGVSRKSNATIKVKSYQELSIDDFNSSEAIIHLAGKAHDLKKTSQEQEYFIANTELTKSMFDKFRSSRCPIFIYMSSVKAVADKVEGVLKEDAEPNPKTTYGKSKLQAEKYLKAQALNKVQRLYILRPCMIHGPNNKGNLNLLYGFIKKGIPYPLGAYKNERSFLSVENLCFIIKELLIGKVVSGTYQVSDNVPLSTNDLVHIIGQSLGKKARILRIPKFIINTFAKIGDYFSLPLTTERLQKLTENYIVSNTKILQEIQKELPLTSTQGLMRTIQSFNND